MREDFAKKGLDFFFCWDLENYSDVKMLSFELQDQFDTIDLSDNEIVKLENFPYLNRLGTLLLNNNRITRINPNIGGEATV